jgi:hypothetical protein
MLFLSMGIVYFLGVSKKTGTIAVNCLGTADAMLFAIPVVTDLRFYDTWFCWAVAQLIVNLILIICLVKEFFSQKDKRNWLYIGAILPLVAFAADVVATKLGDWNGGLLSRYVFIVLFAVTMVMALLFEKVTDFIITLINKAFSKKEIKAAA